MDWILHRNQFDEGPLKANQLMNIVNLMKSLKGCEGYGLSPPNFFYRLARRMDSQAFPQVEGSMKPCGSREDHRLSTSTVVVRKTRSTTAFKRAFRLIECQIAVEDKKFIHTRRSG